MSILAAQPLVAVAEVLRGNWLLIVLSAICLAFATGTGATSLRRLPGPPRIPPERSAWPLAGILFGAMGFWLLAISATASIWATLAPRYGSSTQPVESDAGTAILNTVPSLVGLIVLLYGDRFIYPMVHQNVGLSGGKLRPGTLYGVAGALLVIPPLFLASQVMELVYRSVRYIHPTEHPLLRLLGEGPSPWITATIVVGACLVAPVFEELVFRGHLQTLFLRAFEFFASLTQSRVPDLELHLPLNPDPPQPIAEVPLVAEASDFKSEISNSQVPVLPYQPQPARRKSAIPSILAVLVTSLLFASVHPAWSFPIIFLLSLALGYAYERTGNLWVSITMHAMFNSVSTLLFLLGAGS